MVSHKSTTKLKARFSIAPAFSIFYAAVVCTGAADSFIANPVADAFVTTGGSTGVFDNNNFGGGGALAIAAPGLPKGEFQTLLRFDLSGAKSAFDTEFGAGQWSIQSVTLQLTASPHANAVFNTVNSGSINVSLMQNNSWVEGSGTAGSPGVTGVSFDTLQSTFINNATDQALGSLSFPGGTSGNISSALTLASSLTTDVTGGDLLSLRLFAADSQVSMLFSSHTDTPASNSPELIITAVPEPGSMALGGLGLAMLSVWHFNRKAKGLKLTPARADAPTK